MCFSDLLVGLKAQSGCLQVHGGRKILKDRRTFRLVRLQAHFFEIISQLALIYE